jgi:hypothetical protein
MMVFDLAAVLFLMKSLHQKNLVKLAYLGLSAGFTIAAFLSKGLPGLFPLVVLPVLGWYFKMPFKHAVFSYGLFLSFVMLFSYLVLLLPGAKESLSFYFNHRLLMRISNEPTVASHFHLLGDLIMNLLPIIIFLLILFVYEVRKKSIELSLANDIKHKSLCFLVIAFLASFPLLVTPVQRGFYLHTSFPFYALAGAVWLVPFIKKILLKSWFGRLNNWLIRVSMVFLLFAVMITFASAGKPGKHPVLLEDVHAIGECMKDDKLLSVPAETYYNNWSLQMYLTRFYDITIKVDAPQAEYQLIPGTFAGSNYCYEMKSSDLVLTKKNQKN